MAIATENLSELGHYRRVEYLRTRLDLQVVRSMIANWLINRPGIWENNSDVKKVKAHAFIEALEMIMALDLNSGAYEDPQVENIDVAWLVMAVAITHEVEIDYYNIKAHVNGYGKRDDILDMLLQSILDIDEYDLKKSLENFLIIWLSSLVALPKFQEPMSLFKQVKIKDENNYPAPAFPRKNPFTRVELTEEQRQPFFRFENPRRFLRLIRDFHSVMLGEENTLGISSADYERYLDDYINVHFKNEVLRGEAEQVANEAYKALQVVLLQTHKDDILSGVQLEFLNWKGSLTEYLKFKKELGANGQIIRVTA